MAYYPFSERPDTLVFTCLHVLEGADIATVCHHFNDNAWEFICACENHTDEDACVVTVGDLCEMDPSLHLLSDLPVGACAVRKSRAHAWQRGRIEGEDFYPAAETRMH